MELAVAPTCIALTHLWHAVDPLASLRLADGECIGVNLHSGVNFRYAIRDSGDSGD
jgi:hypothetical protein